MFGPEVIGGIIAVSAATVGIAVKMYTSGGTAEADLDSDGNPELSVSSDGSSGGETIYDDSDAEIPGNPMKDIGEEIESASLPERVKNVGEDLEKITGIAESRAQTFRSEEFWAASDLYYASDKTILNIDGIGEHALSQIRGDIGGVDE